MTDELCKFNFFVKTDFANKNKINIPVLKIMHHDFLSSRVLILSFQSN